MLLLHNLTIYLIIFISLIIFNPINSNGQTNNDELSGDEEQTFNDEDDVKSKDTIIEDDVKSKDTIIERDKNIFNIPTDVEEVSPTVKIPSYFDNGITSNLKNPSTLNNQNHEMNVETKENEEIPILFEVDKTKQKNYGIYKFQINNDPSNGQLSQVDEEKGEVTYKPNLDFFGDDSFEYKVIYNTDPDIPVSPDNGKVNIHVQENSSISSTIKAIANAEPEVVDSKTEFILDGSESIGNNLEYNWKKISGPKVNLQNSDNEITKVLAPNVKKAKELVFELTVVDSKGFESSDQVTIRVNKLLSNYKENTEILVKKIQYEQNINYIDVYGQLINKQNNGIPESMIEFKGESNNIDPNPTATDDKGYFKTQIIGPFKSSEFIISALYKGDQYYSESSKDISLIPGQSKPGPSEGPVPSGGWIPLTTYKSLPIYIILIGIIIGGIIGIAKWKLKKPNHGEDHIDQPKEIPEPSVKMEGGLYDPQSYNLSTLPHISNIVKRSFNIEIITLSGVE